MQTDAEWAEIWNMRLINLGAAGHINPASGFGPWPDGFDILDELRRRASTQPERRVPDEKYLQHGEL